MADPNSVNPYEQIWKTRDLRALETPLELENKRSSFERGVGRFKEQMKGTGYGLVALASQGVQNVIGENPVTQGITDWGLEGYNETTAKSQPGAMYAPKVAKVEDIKTPSDTLEWGAGLLGEQLPLAGSLLLTGGIGGAVARLGANAAIKDIAGAAAGTAVKKGVEQGALKAVEGQLVTDTMRKAASKALLDTTLKGAAITGFAGTAGLEGGQSFGGSVQEGAKPEDAVKSAIAVGGLNGALELLAPFVVAKKMGLGEYAKKSIADIISNDADLSKKAIALATAKELGTRGIKGFVEGAAVEGITEGLQELTSIAGERWAKNSQLFADLTDEDWSQIKNSAAGGAFIGGGLSGAGATVSGPQTEQTKVQTKVTVPAPAQSKLDVLKANQAKLVEQINETIKAGDTKKAEELQAIKGIYDLAINKTQEANAPTLETVKPTEEEVANGQVQAQTEAPITVSEDQALPAASEIKQEPLYSRPLQKPAPTFYSALERATQETKQEKAAPAQWGSSLDNMVKKGLVKQEELDWSGTKEWLQEQKGPVTKEALLKHVRDNTLEVQETSLTDSPDVYALGEWVRAENAAPNSKTEVLGWKWKGESKPSVTLVKVGENDWHTSLSPERGTLDEVKQEAEDHLKFVAKDKFEPRNTTWTLPGGENQRELVLTVPSIEPFNTDDTAHYGDIGGGRAVAWVRFNDRVDGDGKKTLFLEEVQSKRHQEGREKGYKQENPDVKLFDELSAQLIQEQEVLDKFLAEKGDPIDILNELGQFPEQGFDAEKQAIVDKYKEVSNFVEQQNVKASELKQKIRDIQYKYEGRDIPSTTAGVPNAPFKQTIAGSGQTLSGWAGLAFKRMLRYAVENGYDKVAWTTGEQQAERYNLSNKVGSIYYIPEGEGIGKGTFVVTRMGQTLDTSTHPLIEKDDIAPTEIENYIGKELTSKLLDSQEKIIEGMKVKELSNIDLKIGGEGMNGFYDRLLPSEINKYVKKWGAKVNQTQMKFGNESASVHTVEITPAMRDSVMQGQPLFSQPMQKTSEFKKWSREYPVYDDVKISADKFETGKPFVAKVYHGSKTGEIEEFDPAKLGKNTNVPSARKGFFFAGTPETASTEYYVGKPKEGIDPNITDDDFNWDFYNISASIRNLLKSSKLTLNGLQKLDSQGNIPTKTTLVVYPSEQLELMLITNHINPRVYVEKNKEGWGVYIDGVTQVGDYYDDLQEAVSKAWRLIEKYIKNILKNKPELSEDISPTIYPAYIRLSNPMVYDQKGTAYRETSYNDLIKQAKANNHDGLVILNTTDGGPLDNIFVVFDNKNIKGYFNKGTFDETGRLLESKQNAQQPGAITIPLQDLHANINSVMGEGWLQQAIDLGLVEVIEGPSPNGESGSWAGGKIRLYTGSMPKGGSPAGVLLHEGKHATFADVLGDSLQEYVKDLHTLAKNGNKVAQDAITHSVLAAADALGIKHNLLNGGNRADLENLRAIIEARRPGLLAEEELAYFVQYGTDAQGGAGFLRRLINAIKAWFAQTRLGQRMKELGLGFELTDAMAVEWAKMGLNMSLQEAKQAARVRARIEKQAANMPASARLGKALGVLEDVDPLYSFLGENALTVEQEVFNKEYDSIKKKYENTPQWLKAPNGKPTKLNERQWVQVRTPSFKSWFGDWENNSITASKVIDENGEPLVVYHGTVSDINEFDASYYNKQDHGWYGIGHYLTADPETASAYSTYNEKNGEAPGANVIPVFVSIKNPYTWNNKAMAMNTTEAKLLTEDLVSQGYDGVIVPNEYQSGKDLVNFHEINAFQPTQIKSAISNTGAFSPTDSRILYSMGVKEFQEQLWNDPTDPRIEIVNKPGLLQKFRADFVDFFGEMEKKSKNVYDTYILQRAKKGARIEKSRQTYLLPLRELIANSPWDAKEVGDMLAARHIKVDNVNTDLAERASQGYTKELLKALPGAKRKELTRARVNVKAGKMPDGKVYKDANGNVVAMSARTKRKLMFDLMNQYAPFEIANTAGVQELNQEWEIFKDAAGGFSNGGIAGGIVRTVDNVLTPVNDAPAKFDEIANLFDAMNRHTLDISEEGRLITAREHARLLTSKSAYAPLRRESYNIDRETELLFQKASAGGSKQIGTRAGTANLSEPTLVLQNALAKLEATAAAAERNLANQELYNTIMTDREGWKPWFTIVDKDQYVTHDEDGFLQEKHATASNRGNIVLIKDGKKIVIKPNMHNERATGFVRAVNSMDVQTLNGPMKVMSWVNSLIRWTNISASPIFLMTNLIRDPLTAAYNLQATEAAEYSKDIFLNWKRAFKALKKVYIDNNRDLTDADVKMLEKFEKAGGRTSFVLSLKEMDDNSFSNFEGQVARRQGSMKYLMKAKDTWLDGIENYNILFENIMRFSTFMTLQEKSQGKISEQRAARIAQDITTNFSRRGYKSQMLGVWWLFFNASVQGNYQVLRNLMSSKRVQVAVGGTIATAVMLDVLGRALTDDWDEIPEWDKERNIILPLKVGGDFVKIPAPWVYNVFWRMGGMIGETLAGKRKPQDTILDMAALTFTTLDPLGKPGSLAQAISPTAADPFVQILENKNFAGNPIGPEGYPGASTKANSELLWSTTPKGYQEFARFVNEVTGGSAVESGKIDLRPGDYQLLADFLTGSFGKFLTDTTFGFANKLDKGIEGPKDIPIIKEFFSDPSNPMMVQKYHTNIATIYGAHRLEQMYVKGPERDLIKLQKVRTERGNELRMYAQAQDVEKQLKSLRVKLRAAQNREDTGREKELKERMNKVQEQFNKKFEQNVK